MYKNTLLRPFSIAHMYMRLGLSAWHWMTCIRGLIPETDCLFLSQQPWSACSSSSMNGALWDSPIYPDMSAGVVIICVLVK